MSHEDDSDLHPYYDGMHSAESLQTLFQFLPLVMLSILHDGGGAVVVGFDVVAFAVVMVMSFLLLLLLLLSLMLLLIILTPVLLPS